MDKFLGEKTTETDSRRGRKSKKTYSKLKRLNNVKTYQKSTSIRRILWCNLPLNQMFTELTPILHKFFLKKQEEGTFPNSF